MANLLRLGAAVRSTLGIAGAGLRAGLTFVRVGQHRAHQDISLMRMEFPAHNSDGFTHVGVMNVMKEPEVGERAFAMPLTQPAYPRGPYRFFEREYFIITY